MPRTARASVGGVCYHVLNRGNARAEVFHKTADYAAFLDLLADAHARLPKRILASARLPNHFHLVLWPHRDADLSRWMQWLLTAHQPRRGRRIVAPDAAQRSPGTRRCPTRFIEPRRGDGSSAMRTGRHELRFRRPYRA